MYLFYLIWKKRYIYVFFIILNNSEGYSVDYSCIHLVASILWSSEVLTPSCNIFAFYLLYNRKEINSFVFLDDYSYLCQQIRRQWNRNSTIIAWICRYFGSSANGRVRRLLTARVINWSARVTRHGGSLLSLKDVSNM